MLSSSARILNLDDSLMRQAQLLQRYNPSIIDLKRWASLLRHWLDARTFRKIGQLIPYSLKNSVTFFGSGDFHHLTALLTAQFSQPLTVVSFDFHPDWDILPPHLGCGSWVSYILKRDNIKQVILLGIASDDISGPWVQAADLGSLRNERLKIFPYAHAPSRVFLRRVADNSSLRVERGIFFNRLHWQELKGCDWQECLTKIIADIPTDAVYVTIDKDCLRREYALTNWEEGFLSLEDLLLALRLIREKRDIVGLDVTGEYSTSFSENMLKSFFSRMDHPKDFTAKGQSQVLIDAVNEKTNLKILENIIN